MKNFNKIEVGYYTELSKNKGNKLLAEILNEIKKGGIQKDTILDIRDKCKKGEDYSILKNHLMHSLLVELSGVAVKLIVSTSTLE